MTTALAALPDWWETGILIPPEAGTKAYFDQYVEACERLLTDDALFEKLSQRGRERAQNFAWKKRAEGLLIYLKERFGLS